MKKTLSISLFMAILFIAFMSCKQKSGNSNVKEDVTSEDESVFNDETKNVTKNDSESNISGLTWTKVESPFGVSKVTGSNLSVNCIVRGNNMFVVGSYQKVAYSTTDIKKWTVIDISESDPLLVGFSIGRIAYGNGRYVIIDGGGRTAYSDDVLTWYKTPNQGDLEQPFHEGIEHKMTENYGVCYGKNDDGKDIFVAHKNGKIKYSEDGGVTWGKTNFSEQTPFMWLGNIVWGGGKFIALGGFSTGEGFETRSTGILAYSDDGIMWTEVKNHPFTKYIRCAVWDGKNFIAVNGAEAVVHSSNGSNWDNIVNKTYEEIPFMSECMAFGGGIYVSSYSDYINYSKNGKKWTPDKCLNFEEISSIKGLTYGDKKFVAVGSGVIVYAGVN